MSQIPTFKVYSQGKLDPGILKAFLAKKIITNEDCEIGYLTQCDQDYQLILESQKEAQILDSFGLLPALISFQQHKDGQCYAIARYYRAHSISQKQIKQIKQTLIKVTYHD